MKFPLLLIAAVVALAACAPSLTRSSEGPVAVYEPRSEEAAAPTEYTGTITVE